MSKTIEAEEKLSSTTRERLSVLDLLENKNQAANRVLIHSNMNLRLQFNLTIIYLFFKKTILHRIVIVGKLRNFADKSKLGGTILLI